MIIVVSNRLINENRSDEEFFSETLNLQGEERVTLARAFQREDNSWLVEPLEETNTLNNQTEQLFQVIIKGLENNSISRKLVVYVPGFNQSSRQALEAGRKLSGKYELDVILFSWPSNPGGNATSISDLVQTKSEYLKALSIAESSAKALSDIFQNLSQSLNNYSFDRVSRRQIKITLLTHSLGNYVFQNALNLLPSNVTKCFDNIILHQADVDSEKHEQWINQIKLTQNVYITINRHDSVLNASGGFHQSRLGSSNVNNR